MARGLHQGEEKWELCFLPMYRCPKRPSPGEEKGATCGTLGFRFWKVCHYPRGRAVGPGTPGGHVLGHEENGLELRVDETFCIRGASLVAQRLKHLPAMQEAWVQLLGREDPLEKEMATHSSILENPMDGGASVHGVTKSRTRLRDFTFTFFCYRPCRWAPWCYLCRPRTKTQARPARWYTP